ncbi:MAG: M14-type cytosolic carboxypeptidase [Polyangiaceae bacterium]
MTVIDSSYAGGAIELVSLPRRGPIRLALRGDTASEFSQWFAFRIIDERQQPREIVLVDVDDSSYPGGWSSYRPMVSHDGGRTWTRARAEKREADLTILHEPRSPVTEYAYFAPYGLERAQAEIGRAARRPWVEAVHVGDSIEGRPLHLARIGESERERAIWVLARQHPGESPASWAAEGLLRRLAQRDDEAAQAVLEQATVYLVPIVNVDGVELGNHRTNAAGVDLNRAWDDPESAPEVAALLAAIEATEPVAFIDLHADETAPFAFAATSEGNPSYDEEIEQQESMLLDTLARLSPDFVEEAYYGRDEPGEADLSTAANQIGERYHIPAFTLELPITHAGQGRIRNGWSHLRARRLGGDLVEMLAAWLDHFS